MTDTITIDSRESWLAFRADWRLRYAIASENVRAGKRAIRKDVLARRLGDDTTKTVIDRLMPDKQSDLHYIRTIASGLMIELNKAKETRDELVAKAREAIAA